MNRNSIFSVNLLIITGFFLLTGTSCKNSKEELSDASLPDVSTSIATDVLLTTARCSGNISFDGGYLITKRGICYSTIPNPSINDFVTREGDSAGEFTSILTGLKPETKYYYRAYAINEKGISYGSIYSFTTNDSTIVDIENNEYKIIQIGSTSQVWMTENLRTTKYRNNINIENPRPLNNDYSDILTPKFQWAYYENIDSINIYGRLYTWYTVNDARGICPIGWHVSTEADWAELINYLGGEEEACAKLKEKGSAHWDMINNGTDEIGFSAVGSGRHNLPSSNTEIRLYGYFWTANEYDLNTAYYKELGSSEVALYKGVNYKDIGYSVRCVKD